MSRVRLQPEGFDGLQASPPKGQKEVTLAVWRSDTCGARVIERYGSDCVLLNCSAENPDGLEDYHKIE